MKIGITGHTSGLGRALYQHFQDKGYTVLGFSRSNGYYLPEQYDRVVEDARDCDYFFNNAHVDTVQARFIQDLYNDTHLITSGSVSANFPSVNIYAKNKCIIQDAHVKYRRLSQKNMLLLKLGYLENYVDNYPISYRMVLDSVDFWMQNQRISMIEIENDWKLYKQLGF